VKACSHKGLRYRILWGFVVPSSCLLLSLLEATLLKLRRMQPLLLWLPWRDAVRPVSG
jgi:hypothetical protein